MPERISFDHYQTLTREDGSPVELGRGAMGITYKAFDTNLRVNVALKVINSKLLESSVAQQRFLRERSCVIPMSLPFSISGPAATPSTTLWNLSMAKRLNRSFDARDR